MGYMHPGGGGKVGLMGGGVTANVLCAERNRGGEVAARGPQGGRGGGGGEEGGAGGGKRDKSQ